MTKPVTCGNRIYYQISDKENIYQIIDMTNHVTYGNRVCYQKYDIKNNKDKLEIKYV